MQKDAASTEEPAAPVETSKEPVGSVDTKDPVHSKEPSSSMPSTSKEPSTDVPARRARKKTKTEKSKEKKPAEPPMDPNDKTVYVEDMVTLHDFDKRELNFELCWGNFTKLKAFYDLDDRETCTFLLTTCGATLEGKKYWEKFDVPLHLFHEDGSLNFAKAAAEVPDMEVMEGPQASDVKIERPKEKKVRSEVSQGRGSWKIRQWMSHFVISEKLYQQFSF